ncbi:hypothetical protein PVAP13_5NG294400 [Panicum virgatum]|uniref:MADS-box domain-containing protein n=1 Tax=Panicum virgatum TaxID=38727 RepID=A0A8T0RR57_PANVG|nr:hypothetical protein PVAP13_5NG294400 [Panicum virgatum]
MPRGKLGMKLIENPKKRRAAYKNRRDGLVQKTSQLATLCGVDALLICFDPARPAGAGQDGGGGAVTTWPADREDVLKLIRRYRETPADKVRHSFTAAAYHQEELAKQQRKLLKIEQCGPDALSLEDCRLADLSPADLAALLGTLDEALRKAQQRIVALGGRVEDGGGGGDVPAATAMAAAAPAPLPADYNSFDLAFSVPDAGSMVTQYYCPPPLDMLSQPFPLEPPCLAYHMMPPPPGYTFKMPPPPPLPLIAPLDMDMAGTGTVDFLPFATNLSHGSGATGPGFYDDFVPGFDATGGGVCVDGYVSGGGQSFAAGHAGDSYQHEHRLPAGVWPVSGLNNNPGPMDAAALLQERIDFAALRPGSCSSSSCTCFQGAFQKK